MVRMLLRSADVHTPVASRAMDWIYVKNGEPNEIQAAIISYLDLYPPVAPQAAVAYIRGFASGGHAVAFDQKPPAYVFANLICWLDAPPDIESVWDAVGWYRSPSSNIRYFLRPDHANPAGDTLVGGGENGTAISVYLPELTVCELFPHVPYVDEQLQGVQRVDHEVRLDVVWDADQSFGNPNFEITHETDARW